MSNDALKALIDACQESDASLWELTDAIEAFAVATSRDITWLIQALDTQSQQLFDANARIAHLEGRLEEQAREDAVATSRNITMLTQAMDTQSQQLRDVGINIDQLERMLEEQALSDAQAENIARWLPAE